MSDRPKVDDVDPRTVECGTCSAAVGQPCIPANHGTHRVRVRDAASMAHLRGLSACLACREGHGYHIHLG